MDETRRPRRPRVRSRPLHPPPPEPPPHPPPPPRLRPRPSPGSPSLVGAPLRPEHLAQHAPRQPPYVLDVAEYLCEVCVRVLHVPALGRYAPDGGQPRAHGLHGVQQQLLLAQPQPRRLQLLRRRALVLIAVSSEEEARAVPAPVRPREHPLLVLRGRARVARQALPALRHEQLQHLVLVHLAHDGILVEAHSRQLHGVLHAAEPEVGQELQGEAVRVHREALGERVQPRGLEHGRLRREQGVG
mmetsp:Transcript_14395/g.49554  ORF Transcript_14395/g.49554 Transcript_14395/m.49554 type:complete len:244 (+) Transcript_14395:165-896(+)